MKKAIFIGIITGMLISTGCEKFVQVPSPRNQLLNDAVFSDSANSTSAVLGIYISAIEAYGLSFSSGGITVYTGLSGDELLTSSTGYLDEMEFYENSITPGNYINSSFWIDAYRQIYNANACVEGLLESEGISASVKNQLLGEARLYRAFIYFNLVNLYGEVPLVTGTDFRINKALPRLKTNEIFDFLISELDECRNLLKPEYVGNGRLRPNLYAALFLLSKAHLYMGNWEESEKAATEIISSGYYVLESQLDNVFLATSREAIWMISPVLPGYETWEGYFFVPDGFASAPTYQISDSLYNSFESDDLRKKHWTKTYEAYGTSYTIPYKYKLGYDGLIVPRENYVVFRLSDAFLIRGEARAHLNKLDAANEDLNTVRERAALVHKNYTSQTELLNALFRERRSELFLEWGNRWYDLKRTNTANTVLAPIKPGWDEYDALFPIPQTEISTNPFLTQNPGY